jgi:hypothetical protein
MGMGGESSAYMGAESMMSGSMGAMGGMPTIGPDGKPIDPLEGVHELLRYDFQVQFIWQPKTPTQKEEEKAEGTAAEAPADTAAPAPGATS